MELHTQEQFQHSIISYDDTSLVVDGAVLQFPCFVDNATYQHISDLESIIETLNCELLIVGSNTSYPIKEQVRIKQKLSSEFMNITAAIHSFNLMLGDSRSVALVII
jgi:uncharacterized protein